MLQFEIDTKAIDDQLAGLVDKAQRAARLGAKAGAEIYYDAVKAQAPVSKKAHWFHGTSFKTTGQKYWFESGSLKGAVYQYFQRDSSPSHPMYHVAWNHRKVPYGFMVTGGTKSGAKPNDFVGDARKSVQATVIAVMTAQFHQSMK